MMLLLVTYLCGAVGALTRFQLDGWIRRGWPSSLPVATFVINVTGSLALGALAGLAHRHPDLTALQQALGTGFCGGFTTFSTASVETLRLLQDRRRSTAAGYALGSLVGCVVVCAASYLALR